MVNETVFQKVYVGYNLPFKVTDKIEVLSNNKVFYADFYVVSICPLGGK